MSSLVLQDDKPGRSRQEDRKPGDKRRDRAPRFRGQDWQNARSGGTRQKPLRSLSVTYDRLLSFFGPQHWWPGETPFEVCVGAILTQNTNWGNVEKAIANLKRKGLLSPAALRSVRKNTLTVAIRPSGYFNQKSERLKVFARWFGKFLSDSFDTARSLSTDDLRTELLSLKGIGPETADSMLLYAFDRPVFVVDAYTRRLVERHGYLTPGSSYDEIKAIFEASLPRRRRLFNEFHALIVRVGKEYCGTVPDCRGCPIERRKGQRRKK